MTTREPFDSVLENALLFDGMGGLPIECDIGIHEGTISILRKGSQATGRERYSLGGKWVLPGFIDIHTHYDLEVELDPWLPESLKHGVTAVVMGGCSLSVTMGTPEDLADIFQRVETLPRSLIRKWLQQSQAWESSRGYLEHLASLPLGLHVAPMLGHSALRSHVMGLQGSLERKATTKELERMRDLATQALQAGCTGISIDMVPWHIMSGRWRGTTIPSQHAGFEEIRMLAEVCRSHDAVFQVTPNPQRLGSFLELMRLARRPWGKARALRMTVLSALDPYGRPGLWKLFSLASGCINRFLGGNLRFQCLPEPFLIHADGPLTPLFEEFGAGRQLNNCELRSEREALWASPGFEAEFRKQWQSKRGMTFHRDFREMRVLRAPDPGWEGHNFAALAGRSNCKPLDLFIDALKRWDEDLRWCSVGGNHRPEVLQRMLAHRDILPGFTDAGAHLRHLAFYDGALSVLRQALPDGTEAFSRALARVTSEPAMWFGLQAGSLRQGDRADFVVMDPKALVPGIPSAVEQPSPLLAMEARMVKPADPSVHSVWVRGKPRFVKGERVEESALESKGTVLTPSRTRTSKPSSADSRNRIYSRGPQPIDAAAMEATDYWQVFILKHRDKRNVAMHMVAFVWMYLCPTLALASGHWEWLLAMPISQLLGVSAHKLFENTHVDARDAVFSWRATVALHRMFLLFITGRYYSCTERAAAKPSPEAANASEGTPAHA